MLKFFALAMAVIGTVANIALCSIYGWDQAIELKDKATQAFAYGFLAAIALVLHVLAVRIWVAGWRKSAAFMCLVGLLAFLTTVLASVGGLASRADRLVAERQGALDGRADVKRQIDDLTAERAGLKFTRATQATVDAAKALATTAKQTKDRECGNGDARQRGRFCREKEDAEAEALKRFAQAQADKAATDRANEIESELRKLRAVKSEGGVGAADPMKALLGTLLGAYAEILTNSQKLAVALTIDLGVLAILIGLEIMGHLSPRQARDKQRVDETPETRHEPEQVVIEAKAEPVIAPPPRPKLIATSTTPIGSVRAILSDNLQATKGVRVELAELAGRYRAVCKATGKRSVSQDEFVRDVQRFCKMLEIGLKREGEHLYLVNVQLKPTEAENAVKA